MAEWSGVAQGVRCQHHTRGEEGVAGATGNLILILACNDYELKLRNESEMKNSK